MISAELAATKAGLAEDVGQGHVHERLVYYAYQKDIPLKPGATNAADFELVIDHYSPAIEVLDPRGEGALIDAYTGATVQKLSNWVN